ncbi:MAG: histidinol dehydrogenase [Gammaproteobacteria bacterium]
MAGITINSLLYSDSDFWAQLDSALNWESSANEKINETVRSILAHVRRDGDKALVEYTNTFDHRNVSSIKDLTITADRLEQAYNSISAEQQQALKTSISRVQTYHEHQLSESWSYTEQDGTLLGQQVTAIEKVGVYVPGGKAAYPSSVIMNVIPAVVAGVTDIVMVVPTPAGEVNELVFAAAYLVGVTAVYSIGGAQAIAALAYGSDSITRVDKIVGPGNIYVATAKAMVFGSVGIDMIAGPSEILVVCDGKTDPDWIAMDLFSQAEHDEDAQSILISQDTGFLTQVKDSIEKLLPTMERREIIEASLRNRAVFIAVPKLTDAIDVANYIAPEHLELSIENAEQVATQIKHAGAIFMGRYTAEVLGDYCAGPNHVLPTSRTARFSSPLGVYDFQKRSSLIMCSEEGASTLGKTASILARGEGLTAHAQSAEFRIKK